MSREASFAPKQNRLDWKLWRRWTLAHFTWGLLGWAFAVGAGFSTLGIGLLIAGLIVGYFVGSAQWRLISGYVKDYTWEWDADRSGSAWTIATIFSGTLGWLALIFLPLIIFLGVSRYNLPTSVAAACIGGTVLGFLQWLILRRLTQLAVWWIAANFLGMSIGALVGAQTTAVLHTLVAPGYEKRWGRLIPPEFYVHVSVAGVITTTLLGAITGLALVWLLHRTPSPAPTLSDKPSPPPNTTHPN